MKAAGRHLADCGRANFEDFIAYLLRSARRARWNTIDCCERLLEAYRGEPTFWAAEMQRWIVSLESGLTGGDAAVPADLGSGRDAAEAYRWAQSYIGQFGELLECCPDIVSAARQLNDARRSRRRKTRGYEWAMPRRERWCALYRRTGTRWHAHRQNRRELRRRNLLAHPHPRTGGLLR